MENVRVWLWRAEQAATSANPTSSNLIAYLVAFYTEEPAEFVVLNTSELSRRHYGGSPPYESWGGSHKLKTLFKTTSLRY